jgi:hypothetical protein
MLSKKSAILPPRCPVCPMCAIVIGIPSVYLRFGLFIFHEKTPVSQGFFVSAERFELSTNGLKGRCSAVELRARHNSGLHSNMGNIHRQRDEHIC